MLGIRIRIAQVGNTLRAGMEWGWFSVGEREPKKMLLRRSDIA